MKLISVVFYHSYNQEQTLYLKNIITFNPSKYRLYSTHNEIYPSIMPDRLVAGLQGKKTDQFYRLRPPDSQWKVGVC